MITARTLGIRNQAMISVGLLLFAVAAAYVFGGWIADESIRNLLFSGAGIVVLAISAVILRNWRSGFYLFIVWLLFEDLFRKFMGNNMVIYFAKDFMAALTVVSLFVAVRRGKEVTFRPPFMVFISMFFWLGVLQIFNVNSPNILYGLLGLKLYFYYVPLMFVGYALINTDADLSRFFVVNLSLAGIIAALGIVQSIVGPTFLNPAELAPEIKGLSTTQKIAPLTGEVVNVASSVFVSSGRYGWYLEFATILALAAIGYFLLAGRKKNLIFLAAGLIAVAAMLSGSRGAILLCAGSAIAIAGGFLWGTSWRFGDMQQLLKALRRSALAVGVAMLFALLVFPTQVGARWAFYWQTLSPTSSQSEIGWRTWGYPIRNLMGALAEPNWLLGNGIGTASLGTQYVSAFLKERPLPIGVENGYGTLIVEMGILGPILWLLWSSALVISAWRVVRRLKNTRFLPVGFAIVWMLFMVLFIFTFGGIASYQNYVLNAYLWLLVGVLYRLPELATLYPEPPAELHAAHRTRTWVPQRR